MKKQERLHMLRDADHKLNLAQLLENAKTIEIGSRGAKNVETKCAGSELYRIGIINA